MEIRLCGTTEQCKVAVSILKESFDVLQVSEEHSNRGASKLVRVYVTVSDNVVVSQ